nr:farnesyltransferase/geranylgeranyltransferase type-1 subunit alpha [Cryptomonas curvata]
MNFTLIYSYSKIVKHKHNKIFFKNLKNLFSSLDFLMKSIHISNDYSAYSFLALNFTIATETHGNLIVYFCRLLIKKEFSFLKNDICYLFHTTKFYKNFNYWGNLNWLTEKEFLDCKFLFPLLFLKLKISEPKNFHLWNFFLNFFFFLNSKFLEKILIIDFISCLDNFNDSLWHLNFLLSNKIQTQNFKFLKFVLKRYLNFIYESKSKFFKKTSKSLGFLKASPLLLYNISLFYSI